MNKIKELQNVLQSGSRSNKYKVYFPLLGKDFDIQCHDVGSPGRGLGVVDVYLKGREFKIAGDRADEGTITLSFYNDPELSIRRFFLLLLSGVQSYRDPSFLSSFNFNLESIQIPEIPELSEIYKQIKYNINKIKTIQNIDFTVSENTVKSRGYSFFTGRPWYMTDITIEQIGPDEEVLSETVLYNAWITNVGNIDYNDEVGEITLTPLTFAYSGIGYDNDFDIT